MCLPIRDAFSKLNSFIISFRFFSRIKELKGNECNFMNVFHAKLMPELERVQSDVCKERIKEALAIVGMCHCVTISLCMCH